jgi:5-oxoprolinase (ATP-hydrolysing)
MYVYYFDECVDYKVMKTNKVDFFFVLSILVQRGGTFTDCIGNNGSGDPKDDYIIKLLSVDPANYKDSNLEGIRRLLEHFTGKTIPRGEPIDTSEIESLRLGTTVATNALLERKGSRCALITTKGFKDVLVIGNQSRPDIFDLSITKYDKLYETVIEIDERVTLEDYIEDPLKNISEPDNNDLIKGISGEIVRVLKKINVEQVETMLKIIYDQGIRSIAVCLMHSYTYPEHEKIVGEIAKKIGFTNVSLSSSLSPMIKYVNRANSSVADAYLTPEIKKYLQSFQSGLKYGLKNMNNGNNQGVSCQFMQSDGGLVDASRFSGLKAILSGPAGGVVGYSRTCYNPENSIPLIGFDMGGTSTDVSRFGNGKFDHVFETTTAGVTIQSPQLDINTIAAGGGSILSFRNGLMQVGPESASSHPGPACYRKGGPLTVTDANLLLGRLVPEYFPKIFGKNENESLDIEITREKFKILADQINLAHENLDNKSPEEIAYGFIEVACESMARPIRQLTEAKGHIISSHRLVSFGGAGGQCAVQVATILGIKEVLIHRYSSVLSAYGMALADVVEESQEPCSMEFTDENISELNRRTECLRLKTLEKLIVQGFKEIDVEFEEYLNLRYEGTESSIMVPKDKNGFLKTFQNMHLREFGFLFENKAILVDDVRVRASGKAKQRREEPIDTQISKLCQHNGFVQADPKQVKFVKDICWKIDGKLKPIATEIYCLEDLEIGTFLYGPAIIADGTQTNVIPPGSIVTVLAAHLFVEILDKDLKEDMPIQDIIGVEKKVPETNEIKIEPVLLSIFANRFMDIAEQMGTSLQKTSVSVNVKERLDFSCALFDAQGNLVANAPHLPVHLGSMSACISTQAKLWKGKLKPGDILVSNHPSAGGTHLPDITVITPAFEGDEIIFYVASRAHHADIGGLLPGSMPPNSKELWQEGAAIYSEFLVKNGEFQEDKIIEKLLHEPAKYPGCSGTRRLSDNLSDLKAQIAANQRGIQLIALLVKEFGLATISAYMIAIQDNAAQTVINMIDRLLEKNKDKDLKCTDYMDDGSQICLSVYRDNSTNKVVFDFEGTSPQTYNNFNAPTAITYSAIIYCLRCLVDQDIPLNQGCLRPITVKIPKASLLSPAEGSAVVGGNVCTSQRITDTILKTFDVMADSQGCCNNFTFGSGGNGPDGKYIQGFGYYETIAGGHGASEKWNGVSGVHTNMTNTRITDAEIFERRYPIILREFSLRTGSGGKGIKTGGDGVIRDVEFRIPVTASILSERRVVAPHGLHGGQDGAKGVNLWVRNYTDDKGNIEERIYNLGGRSSVDVSAGDRIIIMTPGGGGWGKYSGDSNDVFTTKSFEKRIWSKVGGGSLEKRKRQQFEN